MGTGMKQVPKGCLGSLGSRNLGHDIMPFEWLVGMMVAGGGSQEWMRLTGAAARAPGALTQLGTLLLVSSQTQHHPHRGSP